MHYILLILLSSFLFTTSISSRSLSKIKTQKQINQFYRVQRYFNQGRFKEAISKLRATIEFSKSESTEQKATFLLGKAFLLDGQIQLAKLTFKHLKKNWPNHPYQKEADFLEIEREIKQLSNIVSFDRGAKKLLDFEPFGIDLDFFNFFTGFSKGFVFNNYTPIKKKLSVYFDSKDKELQSKSLLLDGLIETFDFHNTKRGTPKLQRVISSKNLYYSHVASLALMIDYCSNHIEELQGLESLLPKNYKQTNIGQLSKFLLFQITAYIHGDFQKSFKIISELNHIQNSPYKKHFLKHKKLIRLIIQKNKSVHQTLKFIDTLKAYSAFYLIINEYQKLLKKPLNPRIKGNIHYSLAKIYQDDFQDFKLASFHLNATKAFPLVSEVKDEIQWRKIKLLPKLQKESKIHEIANKDLAYTEAAIYQELSQNQLSPKLLDKYFNSLLKLNLDISSKIFYLKKLSEVAEQNHQYLKARFFLIKLARYDLNEANLLLKKNLWKQKVFQSKLNSTLAEEPEKFHFEKGKYLLLLGNEKEGVKTLESISKSKSLYAQKAKFELFTHSLQVQSLDDEEISNLNQCCLKNPDREIQKQARDIFFDYFRNLYRGYSTLETKNKEDYDLQHYEQISQLINNVKRIFSDEKILITQFEIQMLLLRAQNKKARKLFNTYLKSKTDLETLKISLDLNLLEKNLLIASKISEQISSINPQLKEVYLNQAFDLFKQSKFDKKQPQKSFEQALLAFQKKYPHKFLEYFIKQILSFAKNNPKNRATQRIIIEYQNQIIKMNQASLYEIVDQYLNIYHKHTLFTHLKVKILQNSPSFLSEEFLLEQLKEQAPLSLDASIALAQLYKQNTKLKQNSNKDYLKQMLSNIINKPLNTSFKNINKILNFHYSLLNENEYQKTIQLGIKSKQSENRAFYHEKYIELLLQKKKRFRAKREMETFIKNSSYPDFFKLIAYEHVYPHFSKAKGLQSLKKWLFKINSKKLSYEQKKRFNTIAQNINAKAVISTLKNNINWDDPQDTKNIQSFFRIAKLYRDQLKDIPASINIYNQMLEYFSSIKVQRKVKKEQKTLLNMQKVYTLEKSPLLAKRIEAAISWLEDLNNPTNALNILNNSKHLIKKSSEESYINILKVRAYNSLGKLKEAKEILDKLPTKFSSFSETLSKQLHATKLIRKLPTIKKASAVQLIKLSNIYLDQLFDLNHSEQALNRLNKIVRPYQWSKLGFPSNLYLKFYHVAMGKNQNKRAASFLKKAIKHTQSKETLSQIYYTLGAHYFIYEWNLKLAQVYFNASVRNSNESQYSQLSLISLISLYEEQNKQTKALETIKKLKLILNSKSAKTQIESKEFTLKKNIALSKISKYLNHLNQDPKLILKAAKSLAKQKEYYKEAEDKFLLYLRLVEKKRKEELAHQELGDFYLQNKKLSLASKQIQWLYKNSKTQDKKFQAFIKLIKIFGLKMQNFQSAFGLIRQANKLLPNKKQSQTVQILKQKIIKLKKSQKRLNLKTLSYNHFDSIKSIKKKYYKKKQYKKGAQKLEDLIESTENFQLKVGAYYELSRVYDLKLKKYKKALKYYELFFSSMNNPSVTMEILLRIAQIKYSELNDYKKALESYELYIERFPSAKKRIGVLFQIAQIYVKHEREYSRALDTYTDISNAYPQTKWDEKAKLAQADILSQYLSDFQGAILAYRDLINNNFESSFAADALYKIAQIHDRELNDDQSAISVYQEIIEKFPNNSLANTARHEIERIRRR